MGRGGDSPGIPREIRTGLPPLLYGKPENIIMRMFIRNINLARILKFNIFIEFNMFVVATKCLSYVHIKPVIYPHK